MFGYEFLRDQWVLLAMVTGLVMVFYFALHFYDYHKERKMQKEDPEEYDTNYLTPWKAIPLSLKVTITLFLIFAVIFSIHAINHPNSW